MAMDLHRLCDSDNDDIQQPMVSPHQRRQPPHGMPLLQEQQAAGGGSDSDPSPPPLICNMCRLQRVGEEFIVRNGKPVHKRCYNALKCAERMSKKDAGLRQSIATLRADDHDKYLSSLMCLRSDEAPGGRRTSHQRAHMKTFVETMVKKTQVSRKQGVILVTKEQWVAWYHFNELMPADEAAKLWEQEKDHRHSEVDAETGKLLLSIRTPMSLTFEQSVSKERAVESRHEVANSRQAQSALSAPSVVGDSSFGAAGADVLRSMGVKLDASMDMEMSLHHGDLSGASTSGLDPVLATPPAKRYRRDASPPHPLTFTNLAATSGARVALSSASSSVQEPPSLVGPPPVQSLAPGCEASSSVGAPSAQKWTAAEFFKKKRAETDRLNGVLAGHHPKSDFLGKCTRLAAKFEESEKQLDDYKGLAFASIEKKYLDAVKLVLDAREAVKNECFGTPQAWDECEAKALQACSVLDQNVADVKDISWRVQGLTLQP